MNTSDFPEGSIRVLDAERDRALAELGEHFQTGRLTREEFDDRSGRALQARTGNELSGLFADLPRTPAASLRPTGTAPAAAPAPARTCPRWSTARVVIACVVGSIAIGNIVGNVVVNTGHGVHQVSFGWLIPVVVLLIVFRRIGR